MAALFDVDQCVAYAHRVNPRLDVLQLSTTRGDGLDQWYALLRHTASESPPSNT